ncbi:MAG: hypothetical protein HY822_22010 [Acidobacteria bacterium]|nr:hypothetical protein [Acidobacteriota bacterium]
MRSSVIILLALALLPGCSRMKKETSDPALTEIQKKIARYAPTAIQADLSHLSEGDRKALDKMVEAARRIDGIYLRQVWRGNADLLRRLEEDPSPAGKARLHYFRINYGPWSRLDHDQPFLPGIAPKPPQASYYPDDMTREEFNQWVATLKGEEALHATGFFHVIRRGSDGKLRSIPYSEEYREFLGPAARALHEAAALTTNESLKKFLSLRAEAFLSNDYYSSDLAWMELDAPIELAIGPYETYEDELFNYKAAFEAYVTLRDDAETGKLAKFGRHLQDIENHLPIEPRYRNPRLGAAAPIRVVQEVYGAGEGRRGVQTAAFNLPNDERVVQEKGSKRVMLKNVQEAKFNRILVPIAKSVLDASQAASISFEAFFTHILAHELVHGLGPHNIAIGGRNTTVRKELKELYSAVEEAKADATGLFALQYLADTGAIGREMQEAMYTTFLASMFRSVRFGVNEAHGKGVAVQFNYLSDAGAIARDARSGRFRVEAEKAKPAVRALTRELLTLEAEGSCAKAKALLDKYGVIRPEMQQALDGLKDVPVDIEPIFSFR